MTNELVTITFKADQEDIDGALIVFQEYGLTLEEGVILFLRHVAETRTLPDFIEEHLRRKAGKKLMKTIQSSTHNPEASSLSQEDGNKLSDDSSQK